MSDAAETHRFYSDLAAWWPLISPPDEYLEEAQYASLLLKSGAIPVREVLDLGAGGGHMAVHLKSEFAMTLVDIAEQMLSVSRVLNPDCDHHQGDMRTVRLGREFDAVLVHDAICYMTNQADLRRAIETAYVHCRPGGVAVFMPDDTRETFTAASDHGGTDDSTGRGVRYLEWAWDPDTADTWTVTEYAFLLRGADGSVDVVHETHRNGLFSRDLWLQFVAEAGFEAETVLEETTEDRPPRQVFIGRKSRR